MVSLSPRLALDSWARPRPAPPVVPDPSPAHHRLPAGPSRILHVPIRHQPARARAARARSLFQRRRRRQPLGSGRAATPRAATHPWTRWLRVAPLLARRNSLPYVSGYPVRFLEMLARTFISLSLLAHSRRAWLAASASLARLVRCIFHHLSPSFLLWAVLAREAPTCPWEPDMPDPRIFPLRAWMRVKVSKSHRLMQSGHSMKRPKQESTCTGSGSSEKSGALQSHISNLCLFIPPLLLITTAAGTVNRAAAAAANLWMRMDQPSHVASRTGSPAPLQRRIWHGSASSVLLFFFPPP